MNNSTMLDAALAYAKRGLPVFPVEERGKKPIISGGYKAATTDTEQITAWWTERPNANIGIACGGANIVVIDIDPGKGGNKTILDLVAANGNKLPKTPRVRTGGGGEHIYFVAPRETIKNSVGKLGAGVDVRGVGGYIVAPPSIHASGNRYTWIEGYGPDDVPLAPLPEWLVALLMGKARGDVNAGRATEDGRIPEGQRNDRLFAVAMKIRADGLAAELITEMLRALNASACDPPLPDAEVDQIVASVMRMSMLGLRSHSFGSVYRILREDELCGRVLRAKIEFNEMAGCVTLDRKPLLDTDVDAVREAIERMFSFQTSTGMRGLQYTPIDVGRAIYLFARDRRFHPVREYLRGLKWDGKPRLATLALWLRVGDDELKRQILRKWMISAVARAISAGCKVDTILVLIGDQGLGKSTAFKVLMPIDTWFSDTAIDMNSKDAYLALRGVWLVEFAELESLARARDSNVVKAFVTSTSDRYRPPYGREVIEVPRSCLFVATSNDDAFLRDPTGNRRYWPLRVTSAIDIDSIRDARDQLWAEAVAAYDDGEPWYLDADSEIKLAERRREFEIDDPWTEQILVYVRNRERVTSPELLFNAVGKRSEDQTKGDEMRVTEILRRAGWVGRKKQGGTRFWTPA